MTEREKMIAGENYNSSDPDLAAGRSRAIGLMMRINTEPDLETRQALVNELIQASDGAAFIVPNFFCEYGVNIHLGARAFINSGCMFLDCGPIIIGDDLQCGPGVQLLTPVHPLDAAERHTAVESTRAIRIGNDVWLGGGAIVTPGVTIGDRVVIGAGSVVTRDIPSDVVAVGNPARVIKHLPPPEAV